MEIVYILLSQEPVEAALEAVLAHLLFGHVEENELAIEAVLKPQLKASAIAPNQACSAMKNATGSPQLGVRDALEKPGQRQQRSSGLYKRRGRFSS